MSQFSDLLQKAAVEVRHYCETSPNVRKFGRDWLLSLAHDMEVASLLESDGDWLLSLAHDMEVASLLESDGDIERAIDALAYAITDSGPLAEPFAPSFNEALDALQRRRKRERRT